MILKRRKKDKLRHHPSTLVESVMVICVLFLFFFGLLQIMEWFYGFIFCQYSAYYASKGMALGYKDFFTLRAARVAAISISGPFLGHDVSAGRASDLKYAENYMTRGDSSGVWYQYWGTRSNPDDTRLRVTRIRNIERGEITARVSLYNAQLFHEGLSFLLGVSSAPTPNGEAKTLDGSHYLEK